MKINLTFISMLLVSFNSYSGESLSCSVGPIHTELATGKWQVTSCSDGQSLVFATMKNNPAMPFMFFIKRDGDKNKISGEGNGDKKHTSKAFEELKSMSQEQFNEFVEATKKVVKSS